MAESYNHEVSSCGLWPGGGKEGALHSYAYPEPDGFADYPVEPDAAFYSTEYKQSVRPYEAARTDEARPCRRTASADHLRSRRQALSCLI
jgi:hypothetical protein